MGVSGPTRTVTIDNPTIANGLTSSSVFGSLLDHATTIKIKTGLTTTLSTYLENATSHTTVGGYEVYTFTFD